MFYFTDIELAHIAGRIKTLEGELLTSNDIERMLLAPSANEAFKVLNETHYSSYNIGIERTEDFQKLLDAGLREAKEFLEELMPNKWVLNILWYYYDIHNIKTLFRGKFTGAPAAEVDHMLIKLGTLDTGHLADAIYKDYMSFPDFEYSSDVDIKSITKVIEKVKLEAAVKPNILDMATRLDALYFNLIQGVADRAKDEFISEYVMRYTDLFNMQAMIRLVNEGASYEKMDHILVDGGTIDKYHLLIAAHHGMSGIIHEMHDERIATLCKALADKSEHAMENVNRYIQNLFVDFMETAKCENHSLGQVIGYFFAKTNNAQIIRTVMIGRLAGVDIDEIRSHLRNLY